VVDLASAVEQHAQLSRRHDPHGDRQTACEEHVIAPEYLHRFLVLSVLGGLPLAIDRDSTSSAAKTRADAFARLFEAVREGVFIGAVAPPGVPLADTTLAANPHLKQLFGYPADTPQTEVMPFAPERFVDPDARATLVSQLFDDLAVTNYLLRMRRLNGSPVWVEVTARARRSRDGGLLRMEALMRDVSERKRADDQSKDIYQQILQSEKMAALGQTISGVAHELNNPLATILSWAERLSEKSLDEVSKRGVAVILSEADRAARIVRNLLTFARKRQSTRAVVDVNSLVTETIALRGYEQMPMLTVTTELTSDVPRVFADSHQVQQVLLNLLINAEQAMLSVNERGTIVVRTRHDADRDIAILEVADNGPGVAPDVETRIFDPFFTTKDVGQGTGLGLTVAYAILQEHGGRIRIAPTPGGGATFTVELPVSGADAASRPTSHILPPMDAVRGASVLLVEDERALASAVAEALTDAGLEVDHAGDGQEALACMRNANYDVVICDLKMPRVDGMTLYRAIAANTPELARRVIFVTGDVAGTDAERFLEESGCRWLAKPFRLSDLLRAVRETLA
jgi:PAS domain S-box-containing protein